MIVDIPTWLPGIAAVVGVIYAIARNGKRSKKQDEQLKLELQNDLNGIKQRLDSPNAGLEAIKKSADDMRVYCAKTSTALVTQVSTHESEIKELRKRLDKDKV